MPAGDGAEGDARRLAAAQQTQSERRTGALLVAEALAGGGEVTCEGEELGALGRAVVLDEEGIGLLELGEDATQLLEDILV